MKHRNRIILEFNEFDANRLSANTGQPITVDNKLSIGAFDKHQDAIRSGVARITSIIQSLSNTSAFRDLKSKLNLEDQQITELKVLRIQRVDNINYDIYISFIINGREYFGVINNILHLYPEFKSEVFKDADLVQSKEWIIRTKGLIIKIIKKWLQVENGRYKLINDEVICYSIDTGKIGKLSKGTEVEVVRSFDNKIVIKFDNDFYNLINNNYIYFNYWFEKVD